MTVTYRDAGAADAEALTAFFRRVFTATFAHLYSPENLDAFLTGRTAPKIGRELADPAFALRIAEDRGEIAGYIKLGPPSLPFEPRGCAIELRQLYIDAPYHGAGVARELTDWGIAEARRRSADELYLSVFVENHRARRFYARYGFEPVGRYDFIVGTHVDEDVVMRLAL